MTIIVGQDFQEIGRIALSGDDLVFLGNVREMAELARYWKGVRKWNNRQLIENLPGELKSRVWCKAA